MSFKKRAYMERKIFQSSCKINFCLIKCKLLATVIKGNPKAPFSIATTLRCREGHYSFSWIAPLYPQYVPYNAES